MSNIVSQFVLVCCLFYTAFSVEVEVHIRKTTKGYFCAFPTVYKGKTYHDCITLNADKPWCYTAYTGNSWGVCEPLPDYMKKCKLATPNVTSEEAKRILDFHNEVRASMKSKRMRKLMWSSELAMRAQVAAEACVGVHQNHRICQTNDKGGQNLYIAYYKRNWPDDLSWEKIMNYWIREQKYFDINTNTCKIKNRCGHFTQVVWDKTGFIGCGKAYCKNELWKNKGKTYSIHYFCNYYDAGNLNGQPPYVKTEKPECDFCPRVAQGYLDMRFRCDEKKLCEACIFNPNAEGCRSIMDLRKQSPTSNECIDLATVCVENQHLCKMMGKGILPAFVEKSVKLCRKTCKFC